ncbi:uncharacterized protein LOC116194035 [Punica granatum]|uniref:Uncharacterized protein LOC116194035 n=1 Tax=Punica granatum TaxID=22663 RepID=A0A218WRH6_PUNGR|nr:uncharacterized protein LOC116194035 [Punica granatum]OWM75444.1 hypothetical protein CDL15_Pgr021608 [Punica granatum]
MDQKGSDPTVSSSSIALLQERFRELERVKERRVEKELTEQKPTTFRPRVNSTAHLDDRYKLCFPPQVKTRQPPQDFSLSLGLNSQSHLIDPRAMKNLTQLSSSPKRPRESFENSDVDTSLHL